MTIHSTDSGSSPGTSRDSSSPELFAFDFDGVICDSCDETALTAWRASRRIWPERFGRAPWPDYLAGFRRCRPVVETGFHNVLVLDLLESGVAQAQILAEFERLGRESMHRHRLDAATLQERFDEARDDWIREDPESWLNAHAFFPGVVAAINGLRAERCVITTKQQRFTVRLAERVGLSIRPERIFGLDSFANGSKRDVLSRLARQCPLARVHFIEDRLQTLDRLRDVTDLRLYLVDWGYNTERERAAASADPRIQLIGLREFEDLLGGPDGARRRGG